MMTLLGKVCHGVIANDYLVARIKKEKGLDQNCSSNQDPVCMKTNNNQRYVPLSTVLVREVI